MPSAAPPVPRRERRRRDSPSPGFGGGCAERLEGPDRAGADPEKGGAGGGGGPRASCDPCRQRLRGLSNSQSPNHPGRWQGDNAGQNVEPQRDVARHPLLAARCLSAPKGSWVTLSLASLFSHTSAFPYNGKMSSEESGPRPPSCNFVGETFSFLLPPYLETQAYGA